MTDVKMTKFHHVSLAVNDAEKVMETCTNVLGVGPWSSIDLSGADPQDWKAKEYQASVGDVVIEIIQPVEGRIVQLRFLDEGGPSLHNVPFAVEDAEETLAALEEKGAELIVHNPGSFVYVRTGVPEGVVVEISKH